MQSIRVFRHYMRLPLLILAGMESGLFALSYFISFQFRWFSIRATPVDDPLLLSVLVAIVFTVWMAAMGLYEAHLREGLPGSVIRVILALLFGAITLATINFVVPQITLWRSTLLLTVCLAFASVVLVRGGFYFFKPDFFKRRIVVAGSLELAQSVAAIQTKGVTIVGLLPLVNITDAVPANITIIPYTDSLLSIATRLDADAIVVALSERRGTLPIEELLDCKMSGVEILELPSFFEREAWLIKLDCLSPGWLVHSDGFANGTMTLLMKRLLDLCMAVLLGMVFLPFMLIAAAAIFIESGFKHSVFYRQVRIGENGVPFEVIKFRSMRIDAEADGRPRWATKHDARITNVGRFIRKTRIDEMPQIMNIIKGEMSFVGPRPERPEFVVQLARKHLYYASRHRVKPGLTGWAQLCFPYGNTEEDALRKLEYDLYYVKNYSVFLDMLILVETVEVVLFGKGAL